jgi:flagellar basal-body rod protein FlgF
MIQNVERGLYIAASGMLTELQRQDQIANDLANASTPGYKSDRTTQKSFGDMLLENEKSGQTVGSLGMGVQIDSKVTDFTPQPIRPTDEPLDFAIEGDGFFAVQTATGTMYTRNGQFTVNPNGQLTTAKGELVLGQNGQPVTVGADGKADPKAIGNFALSNPRKIGDNMIAGTPTGQGAGNVVSGALEGSGADPAKSMVDMIASFRAFEAGQKVIQTLDETLGKASSSVGSLQ